MSPLSTASSARSTRSGFAARLTPFLPATALLAILLPALAFAQGTLHPGEMAIGSISPVGDSDSWTFTANTGDAIVLRVGEISQVNAFTPRIRLYGPASTLLTSSFGAVAAEIAITAASAGTYTAVVEDNAGTTATGTYRVTLVQNGTAISVSGGDQGGPLTNGAMHTGTIDVGDLDVWTVDASAGDAIVARIGELTPGSALSPQVRIYSPSGTELAVSYGAAAAEVATSAPASGTYLVVAGDYSSGYAGSGDYRLTLVTTGAPVTVSGGDQGGPLTNGAIQTGTIDVGDLDVWTLDATAGDAIVARIGQLSASSTLTPQVRIYSPAGVLLSVSYGAGAAEVATSAPMSGTYLVVAGDYSSGYAGAGDYRLTLVTTGAAVTVSVGDQGGPLTNGAMHTGTIDVGDLDTWTLTASAGDAIVARIGELTPASALTPQVRIYSPSGVLLSVSYGAAAAEVATTAPMSGTYLVVAGDYSSGYAGSGDYRLTLVTTGAPVTVSVGDQGGPLTNGAMHIGTIDVGDLDAWTLTAAAGDAIVARIGQLSASSTLTPQVRIYSPAGVLLSSSYGAGAAEASASAPVSGTYLVVTGDFTSGYAGTGDYRLTLSKTASPVTVSPGDEGGPLNSGLLAGFIDVGDLDVWTVDAVAGQNVIATMEETIVGSPLTPQLRLYTPAGVLLRSSYGASWAQVSAVAPLTGTYLVVAGDYSSGYAGAGAYRIIPAATTDAPGRTRPTVLALAPAAPNPFVSRTLLTYSLPRAGTAALQVYDSQGRLVRTLVDERAQDAGQYEVAWDGLDARGNALRPGLYLARLEAGGRRMVQKVMLAR